VNVSFLTKFASLAISFQGFCRKRRRKLHPSDLVMLKDFLEWSDFKDFAFELGDV